MTDAADAAPLRLFIALELPVDVTASLSGWGSATATEVAGLRALPAASLHVTLCFLGSCPSAAISPIAGSCRSLAGTGAVDLACAQAIWLPERRPRVLAIALADEHDHLAALQARLGTALHAAGWYEPEHRAFLPHVTVARVRHGTRVRQRVRTPVPAVAFRASSVALMRSHLGPQGAVHEPLARVSLERT